MSTTNTRLSCLQGGDRHSFATSDEVEVRPSLTGRDRLVRVRECVHCGASGAEYPVVKRGV